MHCFHMLYACPVRLLADQLICTPMRHRGQLPSLQCLQPRPAVLAACSALVSVVNSSGAMLRCGVDDRPAAHLVLCWCGRASNKSCNPLASHLPWRQRSICESTVHGLTRCHARHLLSHCPHQFCAACSLRKHACSLCLCPASCMRLCCCCMLVRHAPAQPTQSVSHSALPWKRQHQNHAGRAAEPCIDHACRTACAWHSLLGRPAMQPPAARSTPARARHVLPACAPPRRSLQAAAQQARPRLRPMQPARRPAPQPAPASRGGSHEV